MNVKNHYLTIHKFSELTNTTVDTLKHYDNIGLLKPAFIGDNHYRYYLPEQSLDLTRILFGKIAGFSLKEIRQFIHTDDKELSMAKYGDMVMKLQNNIDEIHAIQNTIGNLKYYYQFVHRYDDKIPFSFYLPEWFILTSKRIKLGKFCESSESDVANQFFLKGFTDEKWPHYFLQALFTEEQVSSHNLSEITYFIKIDHPEKHHKDEIKFIPNAEWIGMLFHSGGKQVTSCVDTYLDLLSKSSILIKGPLFIMDVVNCLITSWQEEYCTMIYAMKKDQIYETY